MQLVGCLGAKNTLLLDRIIHGLLEIKCSVSLVSAVIEVIDVVRKRFFVSFDFNYFALSNEHVQDISFDLLRLEWLHVLLQELKARPDFLLRQRPLGFMVRKKHD